MYRKSLTKYIEISKKYSKNIVDGQSVDGNSNDHHKIFSPIDGENINDCLLNYSSLEDVNHAVSSSFKAFKEVWKLKSPYDKSTIFRNAASMIRKNIDYIADVEVFDTGKTYNECSSDISLGADCLEYYAGQGWSLHGKYTSLSKTSYVYTNYEPLGVCVGIGAWNFPFLNAIWKLAPCLMAGNSLIYKPSQLTPLSSHILGQLMLDAGLPPGVFNILQGGPDTGKFLCLHENVSKISFTGSVPTAQQISVMASKTLKKLTMELGGKSALIIYDDACLKNAVQGALMANFFTQGQVCSNASLVFVHHRIYNQFKEMVIAATNKLIVGDPHDKSVDMGPLISLDHKNKVINTLKKALSQGASIVNKSTQSIEQIVKSDEKNYYFQPVILENVNEDHEIFKEEIFGPIMILIKFDNDDEVLRLSNKTKFGLAGGVFTKDIGRAFHVINSLDTSTCYVNTYNDYPPEMAFGGRKMSGFGRENGGLPSLIHYVDMKSVLVQTGDVNSPFNHVSN